MMWIYKFWSEAGTVVQGYEPCCVIRYQRHKPPKMSTNRCLQGKINECGRLEGKETAREVLNRTPADVLACGSESYSHAGEFRAVLEPLMETEAKHFLCWESLGVRKRKVAGHSKNSFIFWMSFVIILSFWPDSQISLISSAIVYSLPRFAAGRIHSQEQNFVR